MRVVWRISTAKAVSLILVAWTYFMAFTNIQLATVTVKPLSSSAAQSSAAALSATMKRPTPNNHTLLSRTFHFAPHEAERINALLHANNDHRHPPASSASSNSSTCGETKVLKCVGISDVNATCLYANLYLHTHRRQLTAYTVQGSDQDDWFQHHQTIVKPNGVTSISYPIPIQQFPTIQTLKDHCQQLTTSLNDDDNNKAVVYTILGTWFFNIGHTIFDGIWAIYLGMLELGMVADAPFHVIPLQYYNRLRPPSPMAQEALKVISGGDVWISGRRLPRNQEVHLPLAAVGAARRGQRTMTADYKLFQGERWLRTFRDRIYDAMAIPKSRPIPKDLVHVRIFDNKRYSSKEMQAIEQVIQHYHSSLTIQIQYIKWQDYPTFHDQIKLVSETDIYITGPGTGLVFSAFLPDGAVVINLGQYPMAYMDEYFTAASPHLWALYYDRCRHHRLEYHPLHSLLEEAIELLGTNFTKHPHDNHSPVGKAFVEFMQQMIYNQYPELPPRDAIYDVLSWEGKGNSSLWAEEMVFEKDGIVQNMANAYGWDPSKIKVSLAAVRHKFNLTNCFANASNVWPVPREIRNSKAYKLFQDSLE